MFLNFQVKWDIEGPLVCVAALMWDRALFSYTVADS